MRVVVVEVVAVEEESNKTEGYKMVEEVCKTVEVYKRVEVGRQVEADTVVAEVCILVQGSTDQVQKPVPVYKLVEVCRRAWVCKKSRACKTRRSRNQTNRLDICSQADRNFLALVVGNVDRSCSSNWDPPCTDHHPPRLERAV